MKSQGWLSYIFNDVRTYLGSSYLNIVDSCLQADGYLQNRSSILQQ
jgi:hypothetical protein